MVASSSFILIVPTSSFILMVATSSFISMVATIKIKELVEGLILIGQTDFMIIFVFCSFLKGLADLHMLFDSSVICMVNRVWSLLNIKFSTLYTGNPWRVYDPHWFWGQEIKE